MVFPMKAREEGLPVPCNCRVIPFSLVSKLYNSMCVICLMIHRFLCVN